MYIINQVCLLKYIIGWSLFGLCCLTVIFFIFKNYSRCEKTITYWWDWILDYKPVMGLTIFIVFIAIIWYIFFNFFKTHGSSDKFGHTFDAINSLFSALAFAGIIFTIFLQMKEFKLQRDELRMTREEFKNQSKEFHIQNTTIRIQRFENTFFQLLTSYQNMVKDLSDLSKQGTGKKYLQKIYILHRNLTWPNFTLSQFKSHESRLRKCFRHWESYEKVRPDISYIDKSDFDDIGMALGKHLDQEALMKIAKYYIYNIYDIPEKFTKFYSDNQDDLGRYFRSLFHIYKLIYTSALINDEDSKFYADLVSAQLSEYEKVLLLYNGTDGNGGYPNFAWLIKEYNILDKLNKELLILPEKDYAAFEKTIPTAPPDTFKIGRRNQGIKEK